MSSANTVHVGSPSVRHFKLLRPPRQQTYRICLFCARVDFYKLWPLGESGRLAKKCTSLSQLSIFTPRRNVTCQVTVLTYKCIWLNRQIWSKINCSYQDLRQLLFMIDTARLYTDISKNRLTTSKTHNFIKIISKPTTCFDPLGVIFRLIFETY